MMRYIATPDGKGKLVSRTGKLLPLSCLPWTSDLLVIDTIPDTLDAEEQFPFYLKPGYRLWDGCWMFWEHCQNKKGPGNSWKVHRDTKYRPVEGGPS